MKPTKTTNRIHFSDLDPLRFEDLCLNMVHRMRKWKNINHFGRKGQDGGVDIDAVEENDRLWYVQCKRYIKITQSELKDIIDKVLNDKKLPDKFLLIISCDLSRDNIYFLQNYTKDNGIGEIEIWTASILEAKLYKDFTDLLYIYFDINLEKDSKKNESKIRYILKMEKRVLKELIDQKRIKESKNFHLYYYEPYQRFISEKVYIRSINDTEYPKNSESGSSWFITFFYDTYHRGIEFWLSAAVGATVIMDSDGFWEPVHHSDKRVKDAKYRAINVERIGRVPYDKIVDFTIDGDKHSSEPHLFCKFDFDGHPFEEIYYRTPGVYKERKSSIELNKEKQTVFPKLEI